MEQDAVHRIPQWEAFSMPLASAHRLPRTRGWLISRVVFMPEGNAGSPK